MTDQQDKRREMVRARVLKARSVVAAWCAFLLCCALLVVGAQTGGGDPKLLEHMRAGVKAREEHRLEDAAREFEAAARIAPHAAEIYANLGLVRHRQGNSTAAIESFQKALDLKPELKGVHGLLGFHLLMLGRVETALEHLEKAEQETPSNPDVNSWLGRAYFESGQYRNAIAKWEAVRKSKPGDLNVLLYLERAYEALLGELREEIFRLDPDRVKAEPGSDKGGGPSTGTGKAEPARVRLDPFRHREPLIRDACTQCHRWSPPGILPRRAWLGKVAKMFGLANDGMLASLGRPIKEVELGEVVAYFETLAPEALETPPWGPATPQPKVKFERTSLRGVAPGEGLPGTANVRLLELFEDVAGPELVVCDMLSGWVSWVDPDALGMKLEGLARLSHPDHVEAVDLDKDGQMDLLVAELGEVMPSDTKAGAVVWLRRTGKRKFEIIQLAENLGRVADAQAADFDGDGDVDVVVAEFGWITVGSILYLENRSERPGSGTPSFAPVTLDDRRGAIHVPVVDLNDDGKPDFLALISQEHETVVAFINRGGGRFDEQEVFTAPHPHWGSSGIEPADLDGDGDLDVLFTNGDTMDDMVRFKPYHGVSWLENRGAYPFVHHRIGRYYGALRAEVGDLDGDGDLDLVATSWLPELDEAKRHSMTLPGVIWYEQVSSGSFQAHVLSDDPCDHPTLEIGDIDGDGRLDVITGTAWLGTPPTDRPAVAVGIWRQIP